ncbi:MAG: hypothetical protein P1P86_13765 [Bacteroidales bacterium]|nr:hypothetical protein [Bacteroidales bacterium]
MGISEKGKNRLKSQYNSGKNWLKWGPYLSERQWGTVREDYSPDGSVWDYFPHDHARSRTYRWGEDGIAGISDEFCNLCFAPAFWNGKDPIIKERLFGLAGNEGNHGEDMKELYYYLDSTPTHSYMKHLYKYPQNEFPYSELLAINQNRSRAEEEYELLDTGIFDGGRYFDIFTEYAKADEEDILIRITAYNRGNAPARLVLIPTLWFRNHWSTGQMEEKPAIRLQKPNAGYAQVSLEHPRLGDYYLSFETADHQLFTGNETNNERIFGVPNASPYVKDAINDALISGRFGLFKDRTEGTKFAPVYIRKIGGGENVEIRLRLSRREPGRNPLMKGFDRIFQDRIAEADAYYNEICVADQELKNIQRQAFAGMLWSKQYYHIDIPRWIDGDPGQPAPAVSRKNIRNSDWFTLNNEDIISMPDKWEYPW